MAPSVEDQKRSKSVGHEETTRIPQGAAKGTESPSKGDKHGLFGRLIQKHKDKQAKVEEARVLFHFLLVDSSNSYSECHCH
jgi:hypothetical protein